MSVSEKDCDLSTTKDEKSQIFFDNYCQPCESDGNHIKSVRFCLECQEYLCWECFKYHRRQKMARDHTLLDQEQMLNKKVPGTVSDNCTEKCEKHQDEFVKYYCPAHDVTGCGDCVTLDHRNCEDVKLIPDVADDIEHCAEYIKFGGKLKKIREKAKEIKSETKHKIELLDQASAKVTNEIKEIRQTVKTTLDELDKNLKEIEQNKLKETRKITSVTDQCTATQAEIETVVKKLMTMKKKCQHSNQFVTMKRTQDRVEKLSQQITRIGLDHSVEGYEFEPNQNLLQNLKKTNALGKLTLKNVNPPETTKQHVMSGVDIMVKTETDTQTCSISSSIFLSDTKLAIVDNDNGAIKIFDTKENQIIDELSMKCKPWDVTKISDSKLAVTLPNERKIAYLKTEPDLCVAKYIETKGRCTGVAYGGNKLCVSFIYPHKVEVIGMNGKTILKITTNQEREKMFCCPYYIALSPDNTSMYVSNSDTNNVVQVGLDGRYLATYADNMLTSPSKVTVDKSGKVYVCGEDSNNVHQITSDCKKGEIILSKANGLYDPRSLALCDKTKNVYVGLTSGNHMKLFQRT